MDFFSAVFDSGVVSAAGDIGWVPSWSWGRKTTAGTMVSPEAALGLSTYHACLRVISEDIMKTRCTVIQPTGKGGTADATDSPLYRLMTGRVNPWMTFNVFKLVVQHYKAGWGNGFAEIERDNNGELVNLWVIHPNRVIVQLNDDHSIVYRVRNNDNSYVEIAANDMFHIRGMGDILQGYSLARYACESIGLAIAMETFGAAFYGNGANPSGVLQHPGVLSDNAHTRMRQSWNEMYQGPEKAHKIAILEEGTSYNRISIPQNEAQFIESRTFEVEEICRWCRVNPNKIQHWARATHNNTEQSAIDHVNDTLMPHIIVWETEANAKLLSEQERTQGRRVHFDCLSLLRGDSAARATYLKFRFETGSITPNQIRALDGENPEDSDAGDKYYIQGQYMELEQVAAGNNVRNKVQGGAESTKGDDETKDTGDTETDPSDPNEQREDAQVAPVVAMQAQPNMDDLSRVHAELFEDAARRLLRKEQKAGAAAIKTSAGNRDAMVAWCAKFYITHRSQITETMLPLIRGLAALHSIHAGRGPLDSSEVISVERTTRMYADDHAAESQKGLLEAFDTNSPDDLFRHWMENRPSQIAEQLASEVGCFMILALAKNEVAA